MHCVEKLFARDFSISDSNSDDFYKMFSELIIKKSELIIFIFCKKKINIIYTKYLVKQKWLKISNLVE